MNTAVELGGSSKKRKKFRSVQTQYIGELFVLLAPALLSTLVFGYLPMISNYMAFLDYRLTNGFMGLGSPFVGFKNFDFLAQLWFYRIVGRTFLYSICGIAVSYPSALLLALCFNELRSLRFKKIVQTISYVPHFVSWVTVASIVYMFLTVEYEGLFNNLRQALGFAGRISFMQKADYFLPLLVVSSIWKNLGWSTILYMSAMSSIEEQLYEAAMVDGASRLQRALFITLPGLVPIFCIQLIFSMGNLFNSSFDQVFNLQNDVIQADIMTLNLYTYFYGIVNQRFAHAAAVGLFNGIISVILICSTNAVTRRLSDTGIF
ncbi:MAG: ABC transporter permease subunit [Christensenellaceae bacterium]|nr:ABC transporter permease subunit [Christensenellaceae bacterium]